MSKKNDKGAKRRAHDFDVQREKEEAEKRAIKLAKKQKAGIQKVKKSKGVRIRKGVVIKGIKVTDAESKSKVKAMVAKAAKVKAKARMDIDDKAAPREQPAKKAGSRSKKPGNQDAMDVQ